MVGVFYLAQWVAMAFVHAPVRTFGPPGTLGKADDGDPVAKFVVDTWFTFGFEVGAIGLVLLVASRWPALSLGVTWTVLAIELIRGILNDVIFIVRGIEVGGYAVWIGIHSVVIITGLLALRAEGRSTSE